MFSSWIEYQFILRYNIYKLQTWNSLTSSRRYKNALCASSSFSKVIYHELLWANSHEIILGQDSPANNPYKHK